MERTHLGDIPALVVGPDSGRLVLVYHGLGADKDTQTKELLSLSRSGFRAVGVDAVGHGERYDPQLHEALKGEDSHRGFLRLLHANLEELPRLQDELRARFQPRSMGLVGISMGGYLAFGAVPGPSRWQAVVSILGCPDWAANWRRVQLDDPEVVELLRPSPHRRPTAFHATPLLALNAGRDVHVPPGPTRQFMADLRAGHPHPQWAEYREYPESDHFLRPQDWDELWQATLDWFQSYL